MNSQYSGVVFFGVYAFFLSFLQAVNNMKSCTCETSQTELCATEAQSDRITYTEIR